MPSITSNKSLFLWTASAWMEQCYKHCFPPLEPRPVYNPRFLYNSNHNRACPSSIIIKPQVHTSYNYCPYSTCIWTYTFKKSITDFIGAKGWTLQQHFTFFTTAVAECLGFQFSVCSLIVKSVTNPQTTAQDPCQIRLRLVRNTVGWRKGISFNKCNSFTKSIVVFNLPLVRAT